MSPGEDHSDGRGARANRGLALICALVMIIALVGFALTRLSQSSTAPAAPPSADAGPFDLRLSGSAQAGDALVPALAQAWLVSRGAEAVDISQRKAGASPLPERIVAARIGEHTVRIDVRAFGAQSGLNDLAAGRTDIAILSQPSKAPEDADGVVVGVIQTPASGRSKAARSLLLVPAIRSTAAAKAFLAFTTSDAGAALIMRAGFVPQNAQPR